jgi:putative ABC transport system permease protein
MLTLIRDVQYAFRSLRRRPAFSLVAIGTLALGAGAATSIYSVVDGILLKPLPYRESDRIVAVWQTYPHWRNEPVLALTWDRITFSYPEYTEWRAHQRSFVDVAIRRNSSTRIGSGETLESVQLTQATASIFNVLRVSPALGRFFTDAEDVRGGPPVVVLSYECWMKRHGGDPSILGTSVRFQRGTYTVIGVLPPGLSLEHGVPAHPYWIPLGQDTTSATAPRNHSFPALGRLKPGVSLAAAAQELERINDSDKHWSEHGAHARQWQMDLTRNVRKPLYLLLAAALVLMLIACVNVATLLLGEATAREHEMAARVALGANRGRLIRQLLTESVVLALAGAALGAILAMGGTKLLVALAPAELPGLANVAIDLRVLAFALSLAVATGLLFGLAPAIAMVRRDPASLLRGGRGQTRRRGMQLQPMLVAFELGMSFVLLVGAGLLTRSMLRLSAVNPGFQRDNLWGVQLSLAGRDSFARHDFYVRATQRLAALPGVVGTTAQSHLPFTNSWSSSSIEREQDVGRPDVRSREAQQRVVMPGFFRLMGIPLRAGRDFSDADRAGATRVMVVSETMARRDWGGPNASPLGQRVRYQNNWWEIVGVVGDVRFRKLSSEIEATVYTPHAQRVAAEMSLLVRTRKDAVLPETVVRSALRELDANALLTRVDKLPELVERSFAHERYRTALISLFSVIAMILAGAGMYGVVSRAVGHRRRELGIRMAIGAAPGAVMRLVVASSMAGTVLGLVAGGGASLLLTPYISEFLFAVSALDVTTYVAVAMVLAGVTLLASWIPARRAARVAPAVVLRED